MICDVMYYVDPARKDRSRLVVALRQKLLEGHFTVKGLYEKLCRRYWWRGMYADAFRVCKGCLTCAAYGGGGRRSKPPLRSILVGGPFKRVGGGPRGNATN